MHFRRRDDHAGARLLDLAADCRIERRQPHLAANHRGRACYHRNSSSPALANSGHARISSSAAAIFRDASAHPARLPGLQGAIIRRPTSIRTSTVSPADRPSSAEIAFGMISPAELPSTPRRNRRLYSDGLDWQVPAWPMEPAQASAKFRRDVLARPRRGLDRLLLARGPRWERVAHLVHCRHVDTTATIRRRDQEGKF